ncbi:hypothetical protein CgIS1_17780 [Frankia sp. CgS1]|nr:hypothetical protein CgIS1_17780 [Frankia sp. CgIS1]
MAGGRVTRDDVARLAGTSTAVVSYVVNGGPRPVAGATRARVLAAIEQLGYRPNALARGLSMRGVMLLGLVVPDAANPFFARLVHAVERAAARRGHLLLVGNTAFSPSAEEHYLDAFSRLSPAALIVVNSADTPGIRHVLSMLDCRVVLLHKRVIGFHGPLVIGDDYRGGWLAAEHLVGHGRKRPLCLSGPDRESPVADRERGFSAALRAAGAPVTSVLRSGFLRAEAMRATLAAIAGSYQPDAIFATTEEHAHGVLAAARAAGVRVPDDLAVLAMDGLPEGEFAAPPLSTVAVDIAGFADMAVNEALNPGPGDTRVTVFGVRLVPRLSCGCAPAPARTSTSTTDV